MKEMEKKAAAATRAERDRERRRREELHRREESLREQLDGEATPPVDLPDLIDVSDDEDDDEEVQPKKKKKGWSLRPENWREIGEHYHLYGVSSTMQAYREEMGNVSEHAVQMRGRRWYKDFINGVEGVPDTRRQSILSTVVESPIVEEIKKLRSEGLQVDNSILQTMVRTRLERGNEEEKALLQKYTFGESWCARFWKRYNMPSRVATTKMREKIPRNFELKKQQYISIGSQLLAKYDIPRGLWFNFDETSVQLVNRAKRTREVMKGARRVRVVGVGHEKSQITRKLGRR